MQESYQRFPKIDYVLLVEPDMRPVSTTFKRSALRQREVVYAVRRSGKESRGLSPRRDGSPGALGPWVPNDTDGCSRTLQESAWPTR